MKHLRVSSLFSIAAGLAAAVALVALFNVALPVAETFEVAAALVTLAGLGALVGSDTARRPAAQGIRPPQVVAVQKTLRRPLGAYGPRAAAITRRRASALVAVS